MTLILHIPYKICIGHVGGRAFSVFLFSFWEEKTTKYYLCRSLSLLQLQPNFTFNLQNLILVVHPFHSIELLYFITSFWPVSEYNTLLPFCFSIFPAEHLRLKPVHSPQEKFENGVFTQKTHQMFHVHTSLEEFTSPARDHLEFVFQKNGYC